MSDVPPEYQAPPLRNAESSPKAVLVLAKVLYEAGKRDNDPSALLAAAKAKNRFVTPNQLRFNFDSETMEFGIELSIYNIEGGVRTFDAYSEQMVSDLGEVVTPYLKAWYLAIRHWPGLDNKCMNTEAEVELMEKTKEGEPVRTG